MIVVESKKEKEIHSGASRGRKKKAFKGKSFEILEKGKEGDRQREREKTNKE